MIERIRAMCMDLDLVLQARMTERGLRTFPHKLVGRLLQDTFPEGVEFVGKGCYKSVWRLLGAAALVVKAGPEFYHEYDEQVWLSVKEPDRSRYFARWYWRTRFFSLQDYGLEGAPSHAALADLAAVAKRYGLVNVLGRVVNGKLARRIPRNVRLVQGQWRIVDATFRDMREPAYVHRRAAGEIVLLPYRQAGELGLLD